jgi:hypothetical protein
MPSAAAAAAAALDPSRLFAKSEEKIKVYGFCRHQARHWRDATKGADNFHMSAAGQPLSS